VHVSFQSHVEVVNGRSPGVLDGRDDGLLVRMSQMSLDVSIVQRLEGRKGRSGIQRVQGPRNERKVDVSMGQEVLPACIE
jgi:hypothetical protein